MPRYQILLLTLRCQNFRLGGHLGTDFIVTMSALVGTNNFCFQALLVGPKEQAEILLRQISAALLFLSVPNVFVSNCKMAKVACVKFYLGEIINQL